MNERFDTLVILGGNIRRAGTRWRTTNFDEGDDFGITGDRIRVIAGALLFLNGISKLIIVSGGIGQNKNIPNVPPVAKVLKNELIELGVPKGKIITELASNNTYEQLKFVKSIIDSRAIKSLAIISNEWHLPRVKTILEYGPHLEGTIKTAEFMSGEEIAIKYSEIEWKDIINKARHSNMTRKRIALEQKGISDIQKGLYKFS